MQPTLEAEAATHALVDREELVRALKLVSAGVENRARERAAAAVALSITGETLELRSAGPICAVRTTVPVVGAELESGLCLPHSALQKAIAACATDVIALLPFSGERLEIRSGERRLRLAGFDLSEFPPEAPEDGFHELVSFEGPRLAEVLQIAARVAATERDRPALNSVAIEAAPGRAEFLATDGFRLVAVTEEATLLSEAPDEPVLVAVDGARALARELRTRPTDEVILELRDDGKHQELRFAYETTRWTIRAPDGNFPRWRQLLPDGQERLELDGRELRSLLQAIEAIWGQARASNPHLPLRLVVDSDGGRVRFRDSEIGELVERLPSARYSGERCELALNAAYLADMLAALDSDQVSARVTGPEDPLLFESSDLNRRYLLMPVRST